MSGWLKAALAAAVVAGLGAIAATVWVGARVREATVVEDPYEAGLRHGERSAACSVAARPCTAPLDGGHVTLELGPRPLRTMRELTVRAELRGVPATAVTVSFAMPGMDMGPNAVRLAPAGPGRFQGAGVLVRCPSGRKGWAADVTVERPGAPAATARFAFAVEE